MSAADSSIQQERKKEIEALDAICANVTQMVKASNSLRKSDLSFLKTTDPEFGQQVDHVAERVLSVVNQMIRDVYAEDENFPQIEDMEDIVDNFNKIVDVTDDILEKSNNYLDILLGRKKDSMTEKLQPSHPHVVISTSKDSKQRSYITAKNIKRPQLEFEDKVDNTNTPFIRKIAYKPNAKRPLNYGLPGSAELSTEMAQHVKSLGIINAHSSLVSLPHPYEYEIQTLEYPPHVLKKRSEILFKSFDETPFTFIDTEDALKEMLSLLKGCHELAVDLEHHDYRSFQGFTCLVQISTRNKDFIVDALQLRSHLHQLNETFTDPNIVKVFHGADMDVKWLQKDFGVYIVNLFDTYHASHGLELGQHSLAHLLDYYCGVKVDKKHQLADWRIRPIPEEMMNYARSDTHYLLFIYDRMRNELINRSNPQTLNILRVTLTNSANTALKKYEKDIYDAETGEGPGGWKNALFKYGGAYNADQVAVFKAIHQWRDVVARREDESTRYILPNYMLYSIVESLPTNTNALFKCCKQIPPYIKMYGVELTRLVIQTLKDARAHSQARAAELARLKEEQAAKRAEWEAKKQRGPLHVRFDEEGNPKETAMRNVEQSQGSVQSSQGPLQRQVKYAITIPIKETCSLLLPLDGKDWIVDLQGLEKAEAIKKNMVLVPPTMPLKKPISEHSIKAIESPKEEQKPVKGKQPTVFVLSDMKREEGSKRKSEAVEESDDDVVLIEHKKASPKKKQRASNGKETKALNITPFDYANAKSLVDQGPVSTTVDIFNPYETKEQNQRGVKGSLSVKPKSIKSMSFMKPK